MRYRYPYHLFFSHKSRILAVDASIGLVLFLWTYFLFAVDIAAVSGGDINTDAQALLRFKDSVAASNSPHFTSWSPSTVSSICTTWTGVRCKDLSTQQRVVSLRLPAKSLFGFIPENSLGLLDAIQELSLRSNALYGELPSDFVSNSPSLRKIYLQNNDFSGALPNIPASWPLLRQLDFSSNNLSGPIPRSLSNHTGLRSLLLQNNSLTGSLPPIDGASLSSFSVAHNKLSGPIPSSLSTFSVDSFEGNDELCGLPLATKCSNVTKVVEAPSPSHDSNSNSTFKPSHGSAVPLAISHTNKRNLNTKAIIGIACGSIAAALVAAGLLLCIIIKCCVAAGLSSVSASKRKAQTDQKKSGSFNHRAERQERIDRDKDNNAHQKGGADPKTRNPNSLVFFNKKVAPLFDLDELLRASAEVLGKGSCGTAYKAMIEDGTVVVVKRLRDVNCESEEFTQKMETLGRLEHSNLVPFKAYYYAKREKLLLMDYMPRGSLSALLHGNKARLPLSWIGRLSVAKAVAKALAYLHANRVVHGNLKSSNVLMVKADEAEDDAWSLADYGLAELISSSSKESGRLRFAMGYMAPEVEEVGSLSTMADVYSFGVLLLELLTGKSPVLLSAFNDHTLDLPMWVHASLMKDPTLSKIPISSPSIFDDSLLKLDHASQEDMVQLLHISILCTSSSPLQRPSMADVVPLIMELSKPSHLESDQDSSW